MSVTLEQLAERVASLEREVANLRRRSSSMAPLNHINDTFGMFADDPEFDEIVRLGREFRNQENAANE